MQMWVKDAASNQFLKVVDGRGGGACPSSRFLTFLTSTQTVPFPTSLLWVHRSRGGGYEAGMRLGAKSTAPMHSSRGRGVVTGRFGSEKLWNPLTPGKVAAVRALCRLSERL